MTAFLAGTQPEAAGRAIHVLDEEKTTVDEFYRILARIFLPRKEFKYLVLPFSVGCCLGGLVSVLSNALHLDRPFMDPSYYAVYAVSRNLDFSNGRMKTLFHHAHRRIISRDEGIRELQQALESRVG
jgi:hypothetical protein